MTNQQSFLEEWREISDLEYFLMSSMFAVISQRLVKAQRPDEDEEEIVVFIDVRSQMVEERNRGTDKEQHP